MRKGSVLALLLVVVALPVGVAAAGGAKPVPPLLSVSVKGSGTVTSDPAGISCPPTCAALFYPGHEVDLSQTPAHGALDAVWKGCTVDGPICRLTMDGAPKASASFGTVKDKVTLTVNPPENGFIVSSDGQISCPGKCAGSYAQGADVKLQAEPAAGYALTQWQFACSAATTTYCSLTNFQGGTVEADFSSAPVTLTVTATSANDGDGSAVGDNFGHQCNSNNVCQFPESPGAIVVLTYGGLGGIYGVVFDKWGGDCSGTSQQDSCKLTMDSAKSATATFHDV